MHWHSILHQLWLVFGWPFGIVMGNLLANFIWILIHDWPQHRATRNEIRKIQGGHCDGCNCPGN